MGADWPENDDHEEHDHEAMSEELAESVRVMFLEVVKTTMEWIEEAISVNLRPSVVVIMFDPETQGMKALFRGGGDPDSAIGALERVKFEMLMLGRKNVTAVDETEGNGVPDVFGEAWPQG